MQRRVSTMSITMRGAVMHSMLMRKQIDEDDVSTRVTAEQERPKPKRNVLDEDKFEMT
jgi:hypothetical protein